MKRIRRFRTGIALATLIATALPLSASRLEAAKPNKGGDGQAAICAYLLGIITYPYTSPAIRLYATSLYNSYGCQ